MKRIPMILAGLIMLVAPVLLGAGAAAGTQDGSWRLTPAGWARGDIEHVRTVPFEAGTAIGGVVHDGHLYVSTWRSFSIYDVSDPVAPELLSLTPLAGQLLNEGPATNGEILLLADDSDGLLQVWDVRDKTAPALLTEVAHDSPDHIWTCVLDCGYAYGSGGTIVDLTDPANAEIVGNWSDVAPFRASHGIVEAEPGVVFVGSLPQYVLDARQNPASPDVVVEVDPPTTQFTLGESPVSYLQWPRGRFALTTLETPFGGPCTADSGGLITYDTSGFEQTGTFAVADVFRITESGLPSDGNVPANALGCSALGLDAHPGFSTDKRVAVGWAENGVRVFDVARQDGGITESAGFIATGTEAFMPQWASDDVLYVVDLVRGLDIFRVGARS